MMDDTFQHLLDLAYECVADGRTDGIKTHTPDKFYEQGAAYQLQHAYNHIQQEAKGDRAENHMAHAVTRLLFYLAIKEKE